MGSRTAALISLAPIQRRATRDAEKLSTSIPAAHAPRTQRRNPGGHKLKTRHFEGTFHAGGRLVLHRFLQVVFLLLLLWSRCVFNRPRCHASGMWWMLFPRWIWFLLGPSYTVLIYTGCGRVRAMPMPMSVAKVVYSHAGLCPNDLNPNLWVDAMSTCMRECESDQVSLSRNPKRIRARGVFDLYVDRDLVLGETHCVSEAAG